ncbi:hypothetical protein K470DRAFT_255422 [Piedraia hortae CBS 480.64]|uniref:Protein kinase domain-containing protein n=1 Tax=Piedraia hortae CBS 480.64 TaxID=1314780 RepID=A0A6A7C8A2_9PEZI|nr:hypothetical protein K470DRAFT_255422 [Piedraia hortae CBS 480.64]
MNNCSIYDRNAPRTIPSNTYQIIRTLHTRPDRSAHLAIHLLAGSLRILKTLTSEPTEIILLLCYLKNHPFFPHTFETRNETPNTWLITLDYCSGGDILDYLPTWSKTCPSPLPVSFSKKLISYLGDALGFLHLEVTSTEQPIARRRGRRGQEGIYPPSFR